MWVTDFRDNHYRTGLRFRRIMDHKVRDLRPRECGWVRKELAVTRLVIVWRNPRLLRCCRRWQRLKSDSNRQLYVVHELVTKGNRRQWVYSSAFELLRRKVPA